MLRLYLRVKFHGSDPPRYSAALAALVQHWRAWFGATADPVMQRRAILVLKKVVFRSPNPERP